MNTDSQWCKQEACFARATRVWLAVNHNTSATSSKRIARSSEPRQLSIKLWVVHEAMNGRKILNIH